MQLYYSRCRRKDGARTKGSDWYIRIQMVKMCRRAYDDNLNTHQPNNAAPYTQLHTFTLENTLNKNLKFISQEGEVQAPLD